MSVEQIEDTIRPLPQAEHARLFEWLDEHAHELPRAANEVSPPGQAELELRRKEAASIQNCFSCSGKMTWHG